MKDDTACRVTGSCVYGGHAGGTKCCNYFLITGELRSIEYPIQGGRCGAYKRGRKLQPPKSRIATTKGFNGYKEV